MAVRNQNRLTPNGLASVIGGDLTNLDVVLSASHSDLFACSEQITGIIVTPKIVLRVLRSLRDGMENPARVQAWASFLRRGFVSNPSAKEPISPIDIAFSSTFEDEIVEVLGRLDELGDLIDGNISEKELDGMIARLETLSTNPPVKEK
ncbi:MAG: hypothetical protein AB1405_11180 [Bdellovibrionota bacterium]